MHRRRPRGSQGCRGLYSTHKEYAKSCRPQKIVGLDCLYAQNPPLCADAVRGIRRVAGAYIPHTRNTLDTSPPEKNVWSRSPLRAGLTSARWRPQGCRGLYSTHKEYAKIFRPPQKKFWPRSPLREDTIRGVRRILGGLYSTHKEYAKKC